MKILQKVRIGTKALCALGLVSLFFAVKYANDLTTTIDTKPATNEALVKTDTTDTAETSVSDTASVIKIKSKVDENQLATVGAEKRTDVAIVTSNLVRLFSLPVTGEPGDIIEHRIADPVLKSLAILDANGFIRDNKLTTDNVQEYLAGYDLEQGELEIVLDNYTFKPSFLAVER